MVQKHQLTKPYSQALITLSLGSVVTCKVNTCNLEVDLLVGLSNRGGHKPRHVLHVDEKYLMWPPTPWDTRLPLTT